MRRPVAGEFAHVALGDWTACGLSVRGSVACWDPWEQDPAPVPVAPARGWDELATIAVGDADTVCGLEADGAVLCVDIPAPDSDEQSDEGFEPWPGQRFKRVSMSDQERGSVCGLALDGSLHCLGRIASELRQWGSRFAVGRVVEVDETSGWGGWVRVDGDYAELSIAGFSSDEYVCLVRADAEVECLGDLTYATGPVKGEDYATLSPPPGPFMDVAAQHYTVCGLRPSGEVDCFGHRSDEFEPDGEFVLLAK